MPTLAETDSYSFIHLDYVLVLKISPEMTSIMRRYLQVEATWLDACDTRPMEEVLLETNAKCHAPTLWCVCGCNSSLRSCALDIRSTSPQVQYYQEETSRGGPVNYQTKYSRLPDSLYLRDCAIDGIFLACLTCLDCFLTYSMEIFCIYQLVAAFS